jgi:hypothetical protein
MANEKIISITKAVGGGALLFLAGAGIGRTTVNGPEISPNGPENTKVVYDLGDAGRQKVTINSSNDNRRVTIEVPGSELDGGISSGTRSHRGAGLDAVSAAVDQYGNITHGPRGFVLGL